jgi:predicted RNA binding protein YcfA (HicA-like mRNA interferase family)
MSKWEKTKEQVVSGNSDANIGFDDICTMLTNLGFKKRISRSSHHIFTMPNVREIINLQPGRNGKAKKYQVRQVRFLIQFYGI